MNIMNVIVPTDFSAPAQMAVNYGVALARKFRAKLTLIHVLDDHSLLIRGAELDKNVEREVRDEVLQKLSSLLAPEDEDDLDLRILVKTGNVETEIAAAIQKYGADIAVLGTHGRAGIGRFILGSTTETLLRKLKIPVLTVSHALRPLEVKRILFATDLAESSLRAFTSVLELARTLQCGIVAIHTVLDEKTLSALEDAITPDVRELAAHEARRRLAAFVAEGKRLGVEVQTALASGNAAHEILKAVEEWAADLIVLTTTYKSVLERTLIGRTAEQVVRQATVPVLSIPMEVAVPHEQIGKVG